MKKSITLVLALMTAVSFAQPYNKTYDVNGNGDNLTPAFVITDPNTFESISVSYASDSNYPQLNYFILTKHDPAGTTIYNNIITPPNAPVDGFTNVEALINTDDGGVLISGYWYKDYSNIIEQPFLMKADNNGRFQWIKIYNVNQKPIAKLSINKISLCRVANECSERYFIVAAGDSDPFSGQDVAVNVIKVENDGKMIFSKKYYEPNSPFTMKREYPGDIEYCTADKTTFMITGYRDDILQNNVSRTMFFFAIDNNGNVLTNFMTLHSKSIPIDQDMVYDKSRNVFTTVFTHEKSSYVTGVNSVMGFISIDPAVTSPSNPRYFWHSDGIAHNGRSISLASQGYVLCSGVYDPALQLYNPAWLKVDNFGNLLTPYFRYNVLDNAMFGHHTVSDLGGNEEFVLVNEQKTDLRVIRTDLNGKACGLKKYESYVKEYDLKKAVYDYRPDDQYEWFCYKVKESMYDPKVRECENNAPSYRAAGEVSISENAENITLYPTMVQSGHAVLTVENNTGAAARMEVRSVSGQLIFVSDNMAAGKSEIKLNNLAKGVYLVQIQDTNNKVISTQKIVAGE